jgi:hypothetical protein
MQCRIRRYYEPRSRLVAGARRFFPNAALSVGMLQYNRWLRAGEREVSRILADAGFCRPAIVTCPLARALAGGFYSALDGGNAKPGSQWSSNVQSFSATATFRPIGQSIVVFRQMKHDRSRFGVFHRVRECTHFCGAVAPTLRIDAQRLGHN